MTTRNLSATVKRSSLPKCWVKDGEKYILTGRGGKPIRQNLPYVSIRFEQVLKKLNIPYQVAQLPNRYNVGQFYTVCTFWNPELYEVENQLLPVYRQVQSTKDLFVDTGKMYEGETFTYAMISKAIEAQKVVSHAVEAQRALMQAAKNGQRVGQKNTPAPIKVDSEFLKKALGNKTAVVVKIVNAVIDDEVKNGDIKIIPAYNSEGLKNGYYGIFDMPKLEYVPVINLAVPNDEASMIFGKGGQNQQYWEYCCDKGIKIIPVKG